MSSNYSIFIEIMKLDVELRLRMKGRRIPIALTFGWYDETARDELVRGSELAGSSKGTFGDGKNLSEAAYIHPLSSSSEKHHSRRE